MNVIRGAGNIFRKSGAAKEVVQKESRIRRIGNYFKRILDDYVAVGQEILQDMKARPIKSSIYIGLIGTSLYFAKRNPSEASFQEQLVNNSNDLLLLSDLIRNPSSDSHIQKLVRANNEGTLRRFSFGVCSIIWMDNFGKEVDVYEAHCKPLKVGWVEMMTDRVVDVGILDRWIYMDDAMIDFDINPEEWPEEENKEEPSKLKALTNMFSKLRTK